MRFAIVKCHGSGNDFPMIDARAIDLPQDAWATVARALADRHGPVGGDGLLLLQLPRDGADFAMAMYNADGSEAEVCLNGLRCVARSGFDAFGIDAATVALKASSATVARDADLAPGVYTVRETAQASLAIRDWPLHLDAETWIDRPIAALPTTRAFTAVAMPNPHLVAFVDGIDEAELVRVGAATAAAPAWLPNRANVSFVAVRGADLFVRTFERGVGLTDSCGSAMAASTYAACLTGRLPYDRALTVFNAGGRIRAAARADATIVLSGNATYEWAGTIDVDLANGTASALDVRERFTDEVTAWGAVVRQA